MKLSSPDTPLISVLVVSYNNEKFIKETIESCLYQDFDNFEVIISDDNSNDNSWEIIKKIDSQKVRAFKQEKNLGEYKNRNFCLDMATGDFVIFMDGEDLLYPHALRLLSYYISKYPKAGQFIANIWNERIIYPIEIPAAEFAKIEFLGTGCTALNFTRLILNRKLLKALNNFDDDSIKLGDLYIQYKVGFNYSSVLIPDGFSWWRRRSGQASESILSNNLNYYIESYKVISVFLPKTEILFTTNQYKQAKINYYGQLLRVVVRSLVRLEKKGFVFYFSKWTGLKKYTLFILNKSNRNYLMKYSGENPFSPNNVTGNVEKN
jgi:glycosyltransferase involved in cell wall biosynthesis